MTDQQIADAKGGSIFHIPTALGAIVPTYNVPEAGSTQLNFTPDDLVGIYLGDIGTWSDPRLVADNPVLANVDQPIVVVHRSDGSGTTFGFTDYLSAVSSDWKSAVGKGTSVNWPVGLAISSTPVCKASLPRRQALLLPCRPICASASSTRLVRMRIRFQRLRGFWPTAT